MLVAYRDPDVKGEKGMGLSNSGVGAKKNRRGGEKKTGSLGRAHDLIT